MSEGPVVSFFSSVLYSKDVRLLQPARWLNDAVITFGCEVMERETFKDSSNLAFLHPSLALVVLLESDEEDLAGALKGLHLEEKELIFLPINDSTDPDAVAGGSHWTLLVIHRSEESPSGFVALHLDSANPGKTKTPNHEVAAIVAGRLISYWRSRTVATSGPSAPGPSSSGAAGAVSALPNTPLVSVGDDCPLQQNGTDCGVHVLFGMEAIARAFIKITAKQEMEASDSTAAASAASSSSLTKPVLQQAVQRAFATMGKGDWETVASVITAYRKQLLDTATRLSSK